MPDYRPEDLAGLTEEERKALLAPPPAPAPHIGLSNLLDLLQVPGTNVGVKTVRDKALKPAANALREATSFRGAPGQRTPDLLDLPSALGFEGIPSGPDIPIPGTTPLNEAWNFLGGSETPPQDVGPITASPGVLANMLVGAPGAAMDLPFHVGREFAAQNVEALPENLAFGAMGKGLGALGQTVKGLTPEPVRDALSRAFVFRGGMTDASKTLFGQKDIKDIYALHDAEDIKNALTIGPGGRPYTLEEQRFLGNLLEQPGQRQALMDVENAKPHELMPVQQSAFALSAQDVPGRVGARARAASYPLPETDTPAQTFAQVAQNVEDRMTALGSEFANVYKKDPTEWSRFMAGNFNPIRYQGNRLGIYPSAPMRERTGFSKMRTDQTDEARLFQGLVTEPAGPMASTAAAERKAINVRQLFNDLALDPTVVRPPMGEAEAALDTGMGITIEGQRYVKMSNDKAMGPLAGQLMRSAEASEVNALTRNDSTALTRTIREWWQSWKFGKTVLSPKTQIRNMFGNAMMAHAEGLAPYRLDIYRDAWNEAKSGQGVYWKEAKDAGAVWTAKAATSLNDILSETTMKDAESVYEVWARAIPKWITSNKGSAKMGEAYQDSESLFKHAVYVFKRRNGVPIQQAVDEADRALINYGKMPQWVKQTRSIPTGIPFITFAYGVTPLIAQAAVRNPRIFLHYKIFADSWNAVAAEKAEATPEEMQAVATMYPNAMPMVSPYRDADGKLHVFDVANFTPLSAVMNPGSFLMGNPGLQEAATQMTGVDPRLNRQVFTPEANGAREFSAFSGVDQDPEAMQHLFGNPSAERHGAQGEHLLRTVAPSPVGDLMSLFESMRGKQNAFGDQQTVGDSLQAALFGGSRKPMDDLARSKEGFDRQKLAAKQTVKRKEKRNEAHVR